MQRDIGLELLRQSLTMPHAVSVGVGRMDAAVKPAGMYSRRPADTAWGFVNAGFSDSLLKNVVMEQSVGVHPVAGGRDLATGRE